MYMLFQWPLSITLLKYAYAYFKLSLSEHPPKHVKSVGINIDESSAGYAYTLSEFRSHSHSLAPRAEGLDPHTTCQQTNRLFGPGEG